jgi:hypothetical protein
MFSSKSAMKKSASTENATRKNIQRLENVCNASV